MNPSSMRDRGWSKQILQNSESTPSSRMRAERKEGTYKRDVLVHVLSCGNLLPQDKDLSWKQESDKFW